MTAYLGIGGGNIVNIENAAHVERIRAFSSEFGAMLGLTPQECIWLKEAMAFSDIGKNLDWVNRRFVPCFTHYRDFERPNHLDRSILSRPHRILEGVMDWLRLYQREARVPLRLRAPGKKSPTQGIASKLETWGLEAFAMEGKVGGEATVLDRFQALRFSKIIFSGETSWFPLGLYFHEIPGYAVAHSWKVPRRVLNAFFAHNGPETSCLEGGAVEGAGLVSSFWGLDYFKPITGPYPLPIAGDRLAYLHTALDRLDQGGLIRANGTFEGGVRKIFVEKITSWGKTPVDALREVLTSLPRQSQHQVNFLAHYGQVTGLETVYGEINTRLEGVLDLVQLVDWTKSDSSGGDTIYLIDGTSVTGPEITPPLFFHLARLSQSA